MIGDPNKQPEAVAWPSQTMWGTLVNLQLHPDLHNGGENLTFQGTPGQLKSALRKAIEQVDEVADEFYNAAI